MYQTVENTINVILGGNDWKNNLRTRDVLTVFGFSKVVSDTTEIDLSSISLKDEKVAIAFPFGEATATITAAVKDGKLDGKWALPTPDGDLSGKWSADPKEE